MERQCADSKKRIETTKANAREQIVQQTAALMERTASGVAGTSSRKLFEPITVSCRIHNGMIIHYFYT